MMLISRREALVCTGTSVMVLAGCATYGKPPAEPGPATEPAQPEAGAFAKTADVPVGSGVIVGDTVLTQPSAGQFNGFSAVCTHAGCHVSEVVDGTINCPCHGSKFNLDGTVAKGPAKRSLDTKAIVVSGDSITLG